MSRLFPRAGPRAVVVLALPFAFGGCTDPVAQQRAAGRWDQIRQNVDRYRRYDAAGPQRGEWLWEVAERERLRHERAYHENGARLVEQMRGDRLRWEQSQETYRFRFRRWWNGAINTTDTTIPAMFY